MSDHQIRDGDAAQAAREAARHETPQEWVRGQRPHPDEPRYAAREGEAEHAARGDEDSAP